MYISGNQYDFEQRLHQLPLSGQDLVWFKTEASGYQPTGITTGVLIRWDREFLKKSWQILESGQTIITI